MRAFAILIAASFVAPAMQTKKPAETALSIVQAILHDRRESAPPILPGYKYVSGELMFFSFRVGGYKVKNDRVDLRWQLIATDPEGLLLWEPMNGAFSEEVSHNDENWLPRVQHTLALPGQLPPGDYKLKVRVADEFGGTTAEHTVQFQVGGRSVPVVESFTILNAAFHRAADDRNPLDPPVYRPGDSVFARFDLAGYKLGEKNLFDVEYGLRVLRPSGKEMFAEPRAASESNAPYYPMRVMRGGLSINLTPDLTPGEYTIVILAKDNIGNQAAEESIRFTVVK